MKIESDLHGGGPVTFDAFAEKNGLTMRVKERPMKLNLPRYYAYFDGVEVTDGVFLVSVFGNGMTPGEAIASYAMKLLGQRIAVDANKKQRREIECPNEWLPGEG